MPIISLDARSADVLLRKRRSVQHLRKRQEARNKGQVAKSQELPGAFILLFAFLALSCLAAIIKND